MVAGGFIFCVRYAVQQCRRNKEHRQTGRYCHWRACCKTHLLLARWHSKIARRGYIRGRDRCNDKASIGAMVEGYHYRNPGDITIIGGHIDITGSSGGLFCDFEYIMHANPNTGAPY